MCARCRALMVAREIMKAYDLNQSYRKTRPFYADVVSSPLQRRITVDEQYVSCRLFTFMHTSVYLSANGNAGNRIGRLLEVTDDRLEKYT